MESTTDSSYASNILYFYHQLSSAEYPQSNGLAELGVKAAKIIVYDNVDNDKVAWAIFTVP